MICKYYKIKLILAEKIIIIDTSHKLRRGKLSAMTRRPRRLKTLRCEEKTDGFHDMAGDRGSVIDPDHRFCPDQKKASDRADRRRHHGAGACRSRIFLVHIPHVTI